MSQCSGISSPELMRLVGITARQLNYWCRIGYIEPHNHSGKENGNPGSGTNRCWALEEVVKVQRFQDLVAAGLEHEPAWELLQNPDRIEAWMGGLADLYYQLTGETVVLQTYPSTPCG